MLTTAIDCKTEYDNTDIDANGKVTTGKYVSIFEKRDPVTIGYQIYLQFL